jgi:hypothetical protein
MFSTAIKSWNINKISDKIRENLLVNIRATLPPPPQVNPWIKFLIFVKVLLES